MTSPQYSLERDTYHGQKVSSPVNFNMGQETVPRYPSLGYEALTHAGAGTGLGYYNVGGAYPCFAGSCSRYGPRICSGLVHGSSTFRIGQPPHLPSALFEDSGPGPVRLAASVNNDDPTRTYDANRASPMAEMVGKHHHAGGHHGPFESVTYDFSYPQVNPNIQASVQQIHKMAPTLKAGIYPLKK